MVNLNSSSSSRVGTKFGCIDAATRGLRVGIGFKKSPWLLVTCVDGFACIDGIAGPSFSGLPFARAFALRGAGALNRGALVLTFDMAGFRTLRFFGVGPLGSSYGGQWPNQTNFQWKTRMNCMTPVQ